MASSRVMASSSSTCDDWAGYTNVTSATAAVRHWHDGGKAVVFSPLQARQLSPGANTLAAENSSFLMLGPLGPSCADDLQHLGYRDDEKILCMTQLRLATQRRILWSVGSNNRFGFEEAAASQFDAIFVFDCTLPGAIRVPDRLEAKLKFLPYCLSATGGTNSFKSYRELITITGGEANAPTVLKMDIEGWEWSTLAAI